MYNKIEKDQPGETKEIVPGVSIATKFNLMYKKQKVFLALSNQFRVKAMQTIYPSCFR